MTSMAQLLEASGFRVRGRRADCPFCDGQSKLTISFDETKGVAYCHRCHWKTGIRKLAREQGVHLPARRRALARERKEQFRKWLLDLMDRASREERRMYRRAEWAKVALTYDRQSEIAWTVLAQWYHARPQFQRFWDMAGCRLGRYELYRTWRRRGGVWKVSPLQLSA